MNKAQIEFLLNTGFSMDEIMERFSAPEPAPAPAPEPAPAPAPKPAPAPAPKPAPAHTPKPAPAPAPKPAPAHTPKPAPAPTPKPAPAPDPFPASMAAIENTMNEIAAMLRTGALAAQFGPPTPERSVNDILAEVVNPPRRSTKK